MLSYKNLCCLAPHLANTIENGGGFKSIGLSNLKKCVLTYDKSWFNLVQEGLLISKECGIMNERGELGDSCPIMRHESVINLPSRAIPLYYLI